MIAAAPIFQLKYWSNFMFSFLTFCCRFNPYAIFVLCYIRGGYSLLCPNLGRYVATLRLLRRVAVVLVLIILLVNLPVFALLKLRWGTYEFQVTGRRPTI